MKERTTQLIQMLHNEKNLTMDRLQEELKVSSRTLRSDIREINDLLEENKLTPITVRRGGNIEKGDDFYLLLSIVEQEDIYAYKLSQNERVLVAASFLINASGYITLGEISDRLYVSRQTIIKDLPLIRELFEDYDMEVISQANKGLRLEGSEKDKRSLLMDMLRKASVNVKNYLNVKSGDTALIKKILSEQENLFQTCLTDESYDWLVEYIGVMIYRSNMKEFIEPDPEAVSSPHYPMAQNLLKYLTQYLNFETSQSEIQAMADCLDAGRYMNKASDSVNSLKAQMVTRSYIEAISDDLGMNLTGDYTFFET